MKKIIFFVLFIVAFKTLSGQGTDLNYCKMTPPSPNAVALGKFGDTPSGGATGIPPVTIPIYTYSGTDEGLNLSVSLDYFAGGIRVDEVASNIGIGWALNAGGVISRTLCGIYDEKPSFGFCNYSLPEPESRGNVLFDGAFHKINVYMADSQYDIFNFNFNGRSGKFILGKNNKILILTQDKLIIEKVIVEEGEQAKITQFTITDERGYRYVFSDTEITVNTFLYTASTYVSSWYLSKIISPKGKTEINFTYGNTTYSYQPGKSETQIYSLQNNNNVFPPLSQPGITVKGKRLEKITFPNGVTLECAYATTTRTDLKGDYLLNKFTISQSTSKRGFTLVQDYSLNRATLRKVTPFAMNGNIEVNESGYEFDYKNPLPDRLSNKQDHWGFYNNNFSSSLIPPQKVNGINYNTSGADRSTNQYLCLNGSLYKVRYPTGGYTEFEMEANTADDTRMGSESFVGGLRLRKMTDYTSSGQATLIKEYEYLVDNSTKSSGKLGVFPVYYNLSYYSFYDSSIRRVGDSIMYYSLNSPNYLTLSSSSIISLCNVNGSPVLYSKITERIKNGDTFAGKTERYFHTYDNVYTPGSYPYVPSYFWPWTYGKVDSVKYYDTNNILLKKEKNSYSITKNEYEKDAANMKAFRSISIAPVMFHKKENEESVNWNKPLYFIYNSFYPQEGRIELLFKETTTYSSGNAVTSSTSYSYNTSNRQLKTETTTNSIGEIISNQYNYPQDMVNENKDSEKIYAGMIAKNMTGYMVETITKNNSKQVKFVRNNFYKPYTDVYLPKDMAIQEGMSSYGLESRIIYHNYDSKGNPVYISKDNADKVVYLWSYNYQYPIAEIKGATYDEVKAALGYSDTQIESLAAQVSPDVNGATIGSKLRSYFLNKPALVTTYTYKPLVGLESVTDPKGVTTTYQYDAFGRLNKTSHNGQTINTYEYHYKAN